MLNIERIKNLIETQGHVFDSSSQEQGNFGCVIFTHFKNHENVKFAIKVFDVSDDSQTNISNKKYNECKAEAKVMTNLIHKNVVEFHSEMLIDLFYFIVMKRYQSSLYHWSKNNQQVIPNKLFFSIALQILDGLEFIHQKKWVLRDLKPQNILIDFDGELMQIKLCDFGAARCYPRLEQQSTQYYGSLNYTPPEVLDQLFKQKKNVKQTQKGDIWAYGICLSVIGQSILNFNDYIKKDWVVPTSPLLTEKAQQFVQFILIQEASKRPDIKKIRDKLCELFKDEIAQKIKSKIDKKLKIGSIFPMQVPDPQDPINPVVANNIQPSFNQNDFADYVINQINSPFSNLFVFISNNYNSSFEINDENFPDKSDHLWIVFVADLLFHFILNLIYCILTSAQNVTLVTLLWVSIVVPFTQNINALKNKKVYFFWIMIQSIIISFLNLALIPQDPVVFNILFAAYQILILIKLLYFLNIPYKYGDQPFCYLILIYPIFLQLQYSSFTILIILVLIFQLFLFCVLLHLWGINKRDHLQGIYVAKQILNLFQNILLCVFYSLGLNRSEDFCAAFLLNIIGIILSSLLQLKIQISDQFTSSYQVIPKIIFLFNFMLSYTIQFCSLEIIIICVFKIVPSFIIILTYTFLFKIEETQKRNKNRFYLETLITFFFLVLDITGLAISCKTDCSQGVAILATLLSLDAILLIVQVLIIIEGKDSDEKDLDSIYITK